MNETEVSARELTLAGSNRLPGEESARSDVPMGQPDADGCPHQGSGESGDCAPDPRGACDASIVQLQVVSEPSPAAQIVPDYLGCSIFTVMFCFLPLGFAALVYSIKTWSANRAGATAVAKRHLMISRQLNIGAVLIGVIVHFVWIARLIMALV